MSLFMSTVSLAFDSAALIIGHHFSVSALWKAPSASGDCCSRGGISEPRSERRARTAGSASVSTTAALSFATTALGVSLGTQRPNQIEAKKPGRPASSAVGMSLADASRALAVPA
jgi:hypothetical protein